MHNYFAFFGIRVKFKLKSLFWTCTNNSDTKSRNKDQTWKENFHIQIEKKEGTNDN